MTLIISRTPTVYSLTQLAENDNTQPSTTTATGLKTSPTLAPDCPVRQIRTSLLPLYRFPCADGFASKRIRSFGDFSTAFVPDIDHQRTPSDDDLPSIEGSSDSGSSVQVVPQRSVLDSLLLAEWEDRAEQGLFRYDVTACPTRVLNGTYGFISQLNEGRASKKRPTEFRVDQVNQPFDDSKFNFCKALQREVLLQFQPTPKTKTTTAAASGPLSDPFNSISNSSGATFTPVAPIVGSPHVVLINVSPIEYGHVLLVPRVLDNLNQLVDPQSMLLALQFAREADNPYLRVGFNSLGAYATINHLHFQAYYLAAPMAIERAPTALLRSSSAAKSTGINPRIGGTSAHGRHRGKNDVKIFELVGYPVKGLVYEAGESLSELARAVGIACQRLTAKNIPHNLLVVDRGARVFLLPNEFAKRKAMNEIPENILVTQVDPAVFEMAGHLVLKRQEDFDVADQDWAWKLLEYASVSDELFAEVVDMCVGYDS